MLISVIIPVYNGEKFIQETMDNLLGLDFKDFEIVLINDGSSDDSLEICNRYKDIGSERVKLLNHSNNLGTAITVNEGIEAASGDYILFLGQDDLLSEKTFEDASKYMHDNTDIIMLSLEGFTSERRIAYPKFRDRDSVLSDEETKKELLLVLINIYGFVLRGFVRREFVLKKKLLYDDIVPEDISHDPIVLLEAEKIVFLSDDYYLYRIHDESIAHSKNSPMYLSMYKAAKQLRANAKKRHLNYLYGEELEYAFIVSFYYFSIFNQLARFDKRDLKLMKSLSDFMKQEYPTYYENIYIKKYYEPWKIKLLRRNDESPRRLVEEFPNCDAFLKMVRDGSIKDYL